MSIRPRSRAARGASGSVDPAAGQTGYRGAERRSVRRFSIAMLNAVHAGGGLGWDSDRLEPFLFRGQATQPRNSASKLKIHEGDRRIDHPEDFDAEQH